MINTRVQKWGNSLGVRIPKKLAKQLAIFDGSYVELKIKNNEIVIIPLETEPTLEELLAQINDDNRHSEIDFGISQGDELN